MKKLISVAASLAMAATMVSSAVPFATGAADATKGFEIRAFEKTDRTPASTTITADQISAGDVVVPIGVYVTENTNDSATMTAQWTVNSKDGDASDVKFENYTPGEAYYDSAATVTAGGVTADTDVLVGFAGEMFSSRVETGFLVSGDLSLFVDDKQDSAGTPNAYGAFTWVVDAETSKYSWAGSKSDDHPILVQDVIFKKGTPAGTYTIDFLDYVPEPDTPENRSCMIESNGKMTTSNKNLTLKGLTITIEGDGNVTTAAPTTTTTTEKTPATTTTTASQGDNQYEVAEDFIVRPATPDPTPVKLDGTADGECYVDYYIEPGDHLVAQMLFELSNDDLPAGFTYVLENSCLAIKGKSFTWSHMRDNTYHKVDTTVNSDPQPVDPTKGAAFFTINIPANTPSGEYTFTIPRYHVVESGGAGETNVVEFDATVIPVTIVVENSSETPGTTTTTKTPETTTTTVATTTTGQGGLTPVYGDANCDNKVNIADVVVLNKWLADSKSYNLTEQGKVNADCCDEKGGTEINANDSDAIIKSIVHLVTLPCTAGQLK